jgi:C1A family cysteine protease
MKHHIYNLRRDPVDERDHLHVTAPRLTPLPSKMDLRILCPPIYDQGELGSCTAQAGAAVLDIAHHVAAKSFFGPSRLFIYWYERFLEGAVNEDSGASIRDSVKVMAKYGACKETTVPYDVTKFTAKPSRAADKEALGYQVTSYARVAQSLNSLKSALAAGKPVTIGISIYESFESERAAKTGIVPLPNVRKEKLLGGHAVVLVGYDDDAKTFLVRNSWGVGWGLSGYFTVPQAYLINPNLSSDFWVVNIAE